MPVLSHKLIAYFETSIPSCRARGESPIRREGMGNVPVERGRPAGAWSALVCKSIDFRASIYPRFMAVYANLF